MSKPGATPNAPGFLMAADFLWGFRIRCQAKSMPAIPGPRVYGGW